MFALNLLHITLYLRVLSFLPHSINFEIAPFIFPVQDHYSTCILRCDAKKRYKDKGILMKYSQWPSFDEDHTPSYNGWHKFLHPSPRNILLKRYSKIIALFIISKLILFQLWKDGWTLNLQLRKFPRNMYLHFIQHIVLAKLLLQSLIFFFIDLNELIELFLTLISFFTLIIYVVQLFLAASFSSLIISYYSVLFIDFGHFSSFLQEVIP